MQKYIKIDSKYALINSYFLIHQIIDEVYFYENKF